VPPVHVWAIDLSGIVTTDVKTASMDAAMPGAAAQSLPNVLASTHEPLASCAFHRAPRSAILDLGQTRVSGKRLVKVLTWFDNEWGYANRMLDVARLLSRL